MSAQRVLDLRLREQTPAGSISWKITQLRKFTPKLMGSASAAAALNSSAVITATVTRTNSRVKPGIYQYCVFTNYIYKAHVNMLWSQRLFLLQIGSIS